MMDELISLALKIKQLHQASTAAWEAKEVARRDGDDLAEAAAEIAWTRAHRHEFTAKMALDDAIRAADAAVPRG